MNKIRNLKNKEKIERIKERKDIKLHQQDASTKAHVINIMYQYHFVDFEF